MANEDKIKIWIHIANLKPLELSVSRSDEPLLRSAEKNVNSLWEKWMNSFGASRSSEDNASVNKLLTAFEQRLDDIVIKV